MENIYAPNIGALQYVRQMLTCMKGEINNNTIIVGDFNTPLTPMDTTPVFWPGKFHALYSLRGCKESDTLQIKCPQKKGKKKVG